MKKHILLLESEQGMERILTLLLKQANFRVSRCRKAESVLGGTDSGTSLFGGSDLLIIDMADIGCEGSRLLRKFPASGHLWSRLNRKILDVALLRLRFCSIVATKSDPNPGAIQVF
ncbi:MAG: hypothetical protein LC633_02485 [Desulfobulbaceae bacterium]|nr:hypothetical protein [Desulfobulbaceae bacterium]